MELGDYAKGWVKFANGLEDELLKQMHEKKELLHHVSHERVLEEIRKNAEEKESLEDTLRTVTKALETSKMASMELANEVAELLVLANIPPSKKEELYSRHRAAVDAIETAEKTEVIRFPPCIPLKKGR